jgi:hypothetical protein
MKEKTMKTGKEMTNRRRSKIDHYLPIAYLDEVRWPPSVGQFDGLDKLGPGSCQAANLVISSAPDASSGVCPARALWGRPAL